MQQKLLDSNEIYTSVGVFKREIVIYELKNATCPVSTSLYFNRKEYNDVSELKSILEDDDFNKLKSEVEMYSTVLDCFMSTFLKNNN